MMADHDHRRPPECPECDHVRELHPRTVPARAGRRRREAILADPGFGRFFTDHMATACWTAERGWQESRVAARAPLVVDPAAAVLHYGQEIFEGLKAYRHADDSVWLFSPEANARRFARSARRLALPVLDERAFLDSVEQLVCADRGWLPSHGGEGSLYLRPSCSPPPHHSPSAHRHTPPSPSSPARPGPTSPPGSPGSGSG